MTSKNDNRKCHLCLKDKELLRSHIVPEFMYRPLHNEKNQYMQISADPSEKIKYRQKGIWERLLCRDCERQFNRYETYIKEALFDGKHIEGNNDGERVNLSGLDYTKTRLFYLSLLWRMSITSQPMYKEVSLGVHEEKIRLMLEKEEPGNPDDYGVLIAAPKIDKQFFIDVHRQVEHKRLNGHHLYIAVLTGLLYIFTINRKTMPKNIRSGFLQEDGTWMILLTEVKDIPFLNEWYTELARAEKVRNNKQ